MHHATVASRAGGDEPAAEVIGLVPAAGHATRLAPLPCSKELFPIGFRSLDEDGTLRPKPVCLYLLESMRAAGVTKAYLVLRKGKWDIPAYLGDGSIVGMHLGYLMTGLPFGPPFTIDQAYPFAHQATAAFGFPDIIFEPADAFAHLIQRQAATHADVVLGLFPADRPQTTDMVDIDEAGRVRSLVIQPTSTHLRYAWIVAVWSVAFTHFLHNHLAKLVPLQGAQAGAAAGIDDSRDVSMGHVLQAALESDLVLQSVTFPTGTYVDVGTPEGLMKALSLSHSAVW